jgi:hypothetical protein
MSSVALPPPAVSAALAALQLGTALECRLVRHLDDAFTRQRLGHSLHEDVRAAVGTLMLRRVPGPLIVAQIEQAMLAQARETGQVARSLLAREPHAAVLARGVARWVARIADPAHACLRADG